MTRRARFAWTILAAVSIAACSDSPRPHELRDPDIALPSVRPEIRPSDGLLTRPELQLLVEAQVRRDVAPLLTALRNPDPTVRARAALALGSVQDPNAVQGLLEGLRDMDTGVRRDAAFALGQVGGFGVADALLSALGREPEASVKTRLLEALGQVGDAEHLARAVTEHGSGAHQGEVALMVGRFGIRGVHDPRALDWLVPLLESPDSEVRYFAGYYFSRTEEPAVWSSALPAVRVALDSLARDDPAAIHLLQSLRRVEDAQDHPRILPWLRESRDWRIRVEAGQALNHPGPSPEVRGALLDALDDPVVNVARAAAQSFAAVGAPPSGDLSRIEDWVLSEATGRHRWQVVGPLLGFLSRNGGDETVQAWLDSQSPEDVSGHVIGLQAIAGSARTDALEDLAGFAATAASDEVAIVAAELIAGTRWPLERRRAETHEGFFTVLVDLLSDPRLSEALPAVAVALADDALVDLGGRQRVIQALEEEESTQETPSQRSLGLAYGLAISGDSTGAGLLTLGLESDDLRTRFLSRAGLLSLGHEVEIPPRPTPEIDWGRLGVLGRHPTLSLVTDRGEVLFDLDAEAAPQTVHALTELAAAGRFNGVPFHRVENNFVIQGGDLTRGDNEEPPGFVLRSEFNTLAYRRGALGMASAGKDTETSQFFVTHLMTPHLDGKYTVFGWVQDGMDVVDAIRQEDRIRSSAIRPDRRRPRR